MALIRSIVREINTRYPEVSTSSRFQMAKAEFKLTRQLHHLLPDRPLRVLDLGTGQGVFPVNFAKWLKEQDFRLQELAGIDMDEKCAPTWRDLQLNNRDLPLSFEVETFRKFQPQKPYDLVCLNAPIVMGQMVLDRVKHFLADDGVIWIRFWTRSSTPEIERMSEQFLETYTAKQKAKIELPGTFLASIKYPLGPVYLLKLL